MLINKIIFLIDAPRETVRKLAREIGKPYKYQKVQKLRPPDRPIRLNFENEFLPRVRRDPDFFRRVCFTDESIFTQKGIFNKQNTRYWSPQNPHWTREVNNQQRWKIIVWAGIVGDQLIGPHIFEENLNGERYLNFLRNVLPGLLANNPIQRRYMWWQQDGAPPHNTVAVQQCLNEYFPNRWIGTRGRFNWPARSPDLTPLDFYLWGKLKDICYRNPPTTRDNMIARIRDAWAGIREEELQRVRGHITRWLQCVVQQNGGHIEHVM